MKEGVKMILPGVKVGDSWQMQFAGGQTDYTVVAVREISMDGLCRKIILVKLTNCNLKYDVNSVWYNLIEQTFDNINACVLNQQELLVGINPDTLSSLSEIYAKLAETIKEIQ